MLTLVALENQRGTSVPGVCVKCTRCEHEVSAFGRSSKSIRFALAQLKRECPSGEDNMYYDSTQTEEDPDDAA